MTTTWADVACANLTKDMLAKVAARVPIASEFIHNEPFPVTANMVADAIMAAVAARHARSNLTSSLFLAQAFK